MDKQRLKQALTQELVFNGDLVEFCKDAIIKLVDKEISEDVSIEFMEDVNYYYELNGCLQPIESIIQTVKERQEKHIEAMKQYNLTKKENNNE
jgi:hypothetical protein